jgi:trehalose-phosphatase
MIRHALERTAGWIAERTRTGRMLVGLDFDGTLAPIVPVPDDARILPAARAALGVLAARFDTRVAIVSGRGLDDVRRRIGIDRLYYAGNHGLEIDGPEVHRVHEEASRARPALVECARRLGPLLRTAEGALLEDKGLTLSIHFRRVADPEAASAFAERVHALCADIEGVRLTDGKMVVEIRPDVPWDKGRATAFLIAQLIPATGIAVFVGDDRTDEDAFRAVGERGEGVIVADPPPGDTAARSYVRSPGEVTELLVALGHG